jgi:predicted nuclease of restriction endonuclease-like (RecB) superfamily
MIFDFISFKMKIQKTFFEHKNEMKIQILLLEITLLRPLIELEFNK